MSLQSEFSQHLLTAGNSCPPGLHTWNGSAPETRFRVYRNNVMVSLIDALADTFPVVQALVGTEFFRAMAAVFARSHPPQSPVMAHYGSGFDLFLRNFPPAAELPYLADMARLELAYVTAYHAADAEPISEEALTIVIHDVTNLPDVRFDLHPSLALIDSPFALASLWFAHQANDISAALTGLDPWQAESSLLVRTGLNVALFRIDMGTSRFIAELAAGHPLGLAFANAQLTSHDFELSSALALLLRSEALTAAHPATET